MKMGMLATQHLPNEIGMIATHNTYNRDKFLQERMGIIENYIYLYIAIIETYI